MKPSLRTCLPLLASALLSLSCKNKLTYDQWDTLTVEEVSTALNQPSGKLEDSEVMQNVQEQVALRIPALVETARFVGHLATTVSQVNQSGTDTSSIPESTEPENADEDDDVNSWSTSLYLKVACPGPQTEPPFDFSNGEVRLLSPELRGIDLQALINGGDFLLKFDECQLGELKVEAQLPGRYLLDPSLLGYPQLSNASDDPDAPDFALAFDASENSKDVPLGVLGFACGSSTTSCSSDVRVAAEFDAGDAGTYVVQMRLTTGYWQNQKDLKVTIRGGDAESSCTVGTSSSQSAPTLDCE